MLPDDLEKAINSTKEDGKSPLAVVATAGTTVLGAFDPFSEIAAICKRHNLWMHIDVRSYLCVCMVVYMLSFRELWEVQL